MRTILFAALIALTVPVVSPAFAAPDPLKAAPDMYSLLFENESVRVMKVTFEPGQKIAEHTHPSPHFVVVMKPGKLTITHTDGTAQEMALEKNQVLWIPAETHWAKNTGTTDIELIVNEVKKAAG